ncbi:hypothetical protein QUE_3166 [Clostridioides difficile P51]|nr:hypothetical protein QUE_3166 [Clostridioides difficile P51]
MGFILTKWYVNTADIELEDLGTLGFILTKWYVNTYSTWCKLKVI